jgi:hypothetical protein
LGILALAIASPSSAIFVALAQLALDRGHLFAQQDFPTASVDRRPGLAPDLLRQSKHFNSVRQDARDPLQATPYVDSFQNVLLLIRGRVHIGRDHVGEHSGRTDGSDCRQQFGRRLRQQLQDLYGLSL